MLNNKLNISNLKFIRSDLSEQEFVLILSIRVIRVLFTSLFNADYLEFLANLFVCYNAVLPKMFMCGFWIIANYTIIQHLFSQKLDKSHFWHIGIHYSNKQNDPQLFCLTICIIFRSKRLIIIFIHSNSELIHKNTIYWLQKNDPRKSRGHFHLQTYS